jgi:hypothetical protein
MSVFSDARGLAQHVLSHQTAFQTIRAWRPTEIKSICQ